MKTLLLIISVVLFHLPLGIYKDTLRRFNRMEQYNPDKAFSYGLENGSLMENSLSVIFYFVSSLLFALIPLIGGLKINWILAIILNMILSFFIIPFVVFYMYPHNGIFTKKSIKLLGVICCIAGLVVCALIMK